MDIFTNRLNKFLEKKADIAKQHIKECEEEKKEMKGYVVEEARMTYDMHKFLKTVREFEADKKKKSKKRVKDNDDI